MHDQAALGDARVGRAGVDAGKDVQTTTLAATAASREPDTARAVEELVAALPPDATVVLAFASPSHPMAALAPDLARRFPRAVVVAASTMGEVGPAGLTVGGISALALRAPARAAAVLVDLDVFTYRRGRELVGELAAGLGARALDPARHVLLTLTDGLSGKEELLVASLGAYAAGVQLVGGSAGDDFRFERTWVAVDGRASTHAAAVLALEPGVAFHTFHLHHFEPTETRVVVTSAEANKRLIHELDGWPAAVRLARLAGTDPESLRASPTLVAGIPVAFAFSVGDHFFLRTVMTVQGDSLLMGGAVEEGAVIRLMRPGDLIAATRDGVAAALARVPDPVAMVLFNCGGRMIEAKARDVVERLYPAMCPVPAVGFTTYGEQFGPVQVNSTLTGLILGATSARPTP